MSEHKERSPVVLKEVITKEMINYMEALKNFKQSAALRTLKGRFFWLDKKCLFSDTKISAPVHSVYAAIRASADFSPFASYLEPNSKETRKSSSIVVMLIINLIKSLKTSEK